MRTLIAGVGYRNLRDLSFGPELVDALRQYEWPETLQIEDLSYGAIAVYQWFEEQQTPFGRAVFAAGAERDRAPGSLRRFTWRGSSEPEALVQDRVAEALTGVISLDNLLVICEWFGVLPGEVTVIELEPVSEELAWGTGLSDAGATRLAEVVAALRAEFGSDDIKAEALGRHA
ncbi:MAG: hypothetical protein ACYDCQ_04165 [Dehalococcoidia bacterium]